MAFDVCMLQGGVECEYEFIKLVTKKVGTESTSLLSVSRNNIKLKVKVI